MCFNRVQAVRLGIKGQEVFVRGWLVLCGYTWPLAGPCSWCLRDAIETPLHKLRDLCLLSLIVSLSAKSDYVFGMHAVTVRCKQVSCCQVKGPPCSS